MATGHVFPFVVNFLGIPGENNLYFNQILCNPTELATVLGRPLLLLLKM